MILLFWRVLAANYEIAESALSLQAVEDETIYFMFHGYI